jgi:hypothetical protein
MDEVDDIGPETKKIPVNIIILLNLLKLKSYFKAK